MDQGKVHHEIEKIDSKVKMCFISGTYLNYEEGEKCYLIEKEMPYPKTN